MSKKVMTATEVAARNREVLALSLGMQGAGMRHSDEFAQLSAYYGTPMTGLLEAAASTSTLPELTRTPVEVKELERDLAEEAEDVLGYKVLNEEVTANDVKRRLVELGIEPFDAKKVEEYKRVMVNRGNEGRTRSSLFGVMMTMATWQQTPINKYTDPIPLHILHRAVEIKKGVPECEVVVDHLVYTTVPDPFLVVKVGKHEFYVDVWDEPVWEGRVEK